MAEEKKKTECFICTGCGIGDSIDIEKLKKVPVAHDRSPEGIAHPFLCGAEGVSLIKNAVDSGAGKIVVAACSSRVFPERFDFGPKALVERVNLRESVAWVSEPLTDDTTMLAEDYLRIGLVKSAKSGPTKPFLEKLSDEILVVGGGISGLNTALAAAKAGKKVHIVEKGDRLGGFFNRLLKRFPTEGTFGAPQDTGIKEKVNEVESNPNIKVYLSTTVAKISGQPGMFNVELSDGTSLKAGAIVQATGSKPYDPSKLGSLGYGMPNVVTNFEFEDMARDGKIEKRSGGNISSVAFLQCAGSRDEKYLPYCSSSCCMTSLKQAAYLRERGEDINIFIIYRDMRTPGKYELFYKKIQEDEKVFFTKGEIEKVEQGDGETVVLALKETLFGEPVRLKVDMLVLATGMESSANNGGALNLTYRQGPELPGLDSGFPDSHFICFPYETRRTGIYAAGTVRQPMDGDQCETDAQGAALKAIQCVVLSSQGKSTHPRSGDTSYPEIATERCTQCKRCTEECPYGMYDEDEKFNPVPNPLRCRRCGTCMGACPQKIISFKDYNVDMFSSMIGASSMPLEEEGKPRVLILACQNDSIPAFDMAGQLKLKINPFVRVIALRCLGSMSMVWLNDAFSKGYDGVILMGCKYGDDYQCHNMRGSELANERMGKLEETLGRMSIEPQRVRFVPVAINDAQKLPEIIDGFMKMIDEVGPNPFKEFAV